MYQSHSRLYQAEGIVLKRKNIGEVDRLLTVFTKEYGKIRVIGKGIRRITSRRAGHVEVFSHVKLTLHKGKSLDIVTEATLMSQHGFVDLEQVSHAYYLCELIDTLLPDRQEQDDVFVLLQQAIRGLTSIVNAKEAASTVEAFAVELLWILGYLPRGKPLSSASLTPYIESIIERKLKTVRILTKM